MASEYKMTVEHKMAAYDECRLCPRMCGAHRSEGKKGFCGMDGKLMLARAALHMWEEPCISGMCGSGTVFFTGCTLRCVFCQNYDIAAGTYGCEVSVSRLSEIFIELQQKGAANINLVTPSHYVPHIVKALEQAKQSADMPLTIPVVYNTSGYERVETLRMLDGLVDIYLPDFKYMDNTLAEAYSRAKDYPKVASDALAEMVRQRGKAVFFENGMMKSGVIVRHLMLPGQLMDSKHIVKYLYETYGDDIYISLMNQYTPLAQVAHIPELNCRVKKKSYNKLVDYALSLGVVNAFIQEGSTAEESFIPPFDGEGL